MATGRSPFSGPSVELTLLILIVAVVILGFVSKKATARREAERLRTAQLRQAQQQKEEAEKLRANLPPLQPGSLLRATIDPLGSTSFRVIVQLSRRAFDILDRGLWDYSLGNVPNPNYAKELSDYEIEQQTHQQMLLDKYMQQYAKEHPPKKQKPPETVPLTIRELCAPLGYTRYCDTVSDAKALTDQIRGMLQKLKSFIEQNDKPQEKMTFDL